MEKYNAGNMTGDYAMIAEGLGARGITVTQPEEIGPAVREAHRENFENGRSALIDVHTQQELSFSIYD